MKIVIDIPKGRYEDILSGKEVTIYQCDIRDVLKNGTPLETVLENIKAEIEEEKQGYDLYNNDDNNVLYGLQTCIGIIDNHISGKENEE